MTNKKALLAISIAAILSMGISYPAIAEAITPLKQTVVDVNDNGTFNVRFQLNDKVANEVAPFGGYAVLTDVGTAIAVTSHAGFYDSEVQGDGTNLDTPIIDFPGPAALCSSTVGCGGEWHTHIVIPAADARCATGLKVGELTWDDPSVKLHLAGPNIIAQKIALGANDYTASLAGGTLSFNAGSDPDANGSVAFDLTPIFLVSDDPTTLDAVCIGPLA